MADFLFYLMALGAVLSALGVVGLRTPMASVLSLLGGFFCLATIYLLAGFPLLAAIQLLVYAGAILVLFLFVIMLLNLTDASHVTPLSAEVLRSRQVGLVGAVAGSLMAVGLGALLVGEVRTADPALVGQRLDELTPLALALFGRHMLAFEAISLLLLATAVAVLVLAKRERGAPATASTSLAASAPRPHASGPGAKGSAEDERRASSRELAGSGGRR